MDVSALARAVAEDVGAGLIPVAVVATAGTTNEGAVDDLDRCADVAERYGAALHVDAAYGGAFALTARGRAALAGISRADTVVVDPHKGLFAPYGLGALLAKDGASLHRANRGDGACMPPPASEEGRGGGGYDIMNLSPELTRDFRALRPARNPSRFKIPSST